MRPPGEFAAMLQSVQAQHRTQSRQLLGLRQDVRRRRCPLRIPLQPRARHDRYQLNDRLADSERPGRV